MINKYKIRLASSYVEEMWQFADTHRVLFHHVNKKIGRKKTPTTDNVKYTYEGWMDEGTLLLLKLHIPFVEIV